MTEHSPAVAMGLRALTCAMKAKLDQLRFTDRLDLALMALELARDDAAFCDRVVALCKARPDHQSAAGADLWDHLWLHGVMGIRPAAGANAEATLAAIQNEDGWATRADIYG